MAKKKKLNIADINTSKKNVFVTNSEDETRAIGKLFSKYLNRSDIVFLFGDLGSGKTTFSQGIVSAFGNKGFARSSSFMLVNEYKAKDCKLYHIDLYRLSPSNVFDIGIEEYLFSKNISLVEWPDRLLDMQNDSTWKVWIENIGSQRKITIEKTK